MKTATVYEVDDFEQGAPFYVPTLAEARRIAGRQDSVTKLTVALTPTREAVCNLLNNQQFVVARETVAT